MGNKNVQLALRHDCKMSWFNCWIALLYVLPSMNQTWLATNQAIVCLHQRQIQGEGSRGCDPPLGAITPLCLTTCIASNSSEFKMKKIYIFKHNPYPNRPHPPSSPIPLALGRFPWILKITTPSLKKSWIRPCSLLPKALFCNKWRESRVWHDSRVILTNQKSVFSQLSTTWFVARWVWMRVVKCTT